MKNFTLILLTLCIVSFADTEFAEPKPAIDNQRQIVFSIKSGDDEEIHHVLSSANNVLKFYGPENVEMKIVAYSKGIKTLLKIHKEIALRVRALMLLDVEFIACRNTMKTKKIKEEELIEDSVIVTAGIVEIIERVKDGWINIVP
ncbi:DsrE family protein [Sulfurimonas sp. CS5]|jgi:intracellular sulfur oxidation DsrE/DsrF family protein|uniref:DsrE family protein n=1 Tax=Sulfurimonas sp. CS5 TaxID=3391145 RepID=UPI0039E76C5F